MIRPDPGIMEQPPRRADEPLIQKPMLVRAWLFLGAIVALLSMGGFLYVLTDAGWHLGAPQRAPDTRFTTPTGRPRRCTGSE